MLKGRELHEVREKVNRDYVRKKLHCTGKEISVYLTSHNHQFKGEVDEVLFLEGGTAAILDRITHHALILNMNGKSFRRR